MYRSLEVKSITSVNCLTVSRHITNVKTYKCEFVEYFRVFCLFLQKLNFLCSWIVWIIEDFFLQLNFFTTFKMIRPGFSVPLHYQIIIALFAGGLFGFFFYNKVVYTNWAGEVFLRALSMIIVPLILCSITTGVASVGSGGNLGRLGLIDKISTIYADGIFNNIIQCHAASYNGSC